MKKILKDYFTFTKKERAGIIIILMLIFCGMIFPAIYSILRPSEHLNYITIKADIDSLEIRNKDSSYYKKRSTVFYNAYSEKKIKHSIDSKAILFDFDPNTASTEDWLKMGIRLKTTITIKNYLAKGGHFYKPADISKIYGLQQKDVERLLPYIKIRSRNDVINKKGGLFYAYHKKAEAGSIDINTIDSIGLTSLPGIGPSFSRRIINFRNRLGGFHSIDQVSETYGLPDSTYKRIRPKLFISDSSVKKINVNTASIEELKAHPYIRYRLANLILQYRKQHGNFSGMDDVKKILIINEPELSKIQPYLSFN